MKHVLTADLQKGQAAACTVNTTVPNGLSWVTWLCLKSFLEKLSLLEGHEGEKLQRGLY